MGAFIWEDNIAGRVFPFGTITVILKWRSFMMSYEENPIAKGVSFMSSMTSQENVEQIAVSASPCVFKWVQEYGAGLSQPCPL